MESFSRAIEPGADDAKTYLLLATYDIRNRDFKKSLDYCERGLAKA